jgi:adenylate cyclase
MSPPRSRARIRSLLGRMGTALAIAAFVVLLTQAPLLKLGVLERLELATLDYRFQARGTRFATPDSLHVVVLEISEDSFQSLPDRYPWPRSYYAHALRNLKEAGARAVGIDLIFDAPDATDPGADSVLREAIRETGITVLAGKREEDRAFVRSASLQEDYQNIFYDVDSCLGLVNIRPDDDGIYRIYNVAYAVDAPGGIVRHVPTFGFAVLNKVLGLPPGTTPRPEGSDFVYGPWTIPSYDPASLLVNFYGPSRTFPHIKFHDVLDDSSFQTLDEIKSGETINTFSDPDYGYLVDSTFHDKIVLIGVTIPEFKDLFPVSIAQGEQRGDNLMYGVEIHANLIESVLRGDFLTRQSLVSESITVVALVLLSFFLTARFKLLRFRHQMLVEVFAFLTALVLAALVAVAALELFLSAGYILNVTAAVLALGAGYGGSTVAHLVSERKQRLMIKSMFSTYVNPSVVDELIADPDKLSLGGRRVELSVLFSDIEGFTTLSENMSPETLVGLLNEYLSAMTEIIFRTNGTLDKYEGDAIMAFWGAPVWQEDHAMRACLSALDMQEAVARINTTWPAEGKPRIAVRIGINTGEMVVGNMGATGKFDYTVIGDNVNLASRLEGANKFYSTRIMVSQRTYDQVRHEILGRELGRIAVKGRSQAVTTYELLGRRRAGPQLEELSSSRQLWNSARATARASSI